MGIRAMVALGLWMTLSGVALAGATGAETTVVPTPGAGALVLLAGAVAARRKRP